MLVPLGWTWGITSLILVGLVTAYANWLLAEFHFIDGRRFIRYRDLMGHLFGRSNKDRNYDIYGSNFSKVMNGFGAISAIIVCNTGGILPELQSTLRKPAVKNMRKALYLQYTVGLFFYYGVSIVGYWAYGSAVSAYLPEDLNGPKWANVTINAISFVQSIISQHMFIAPIHETLDTKFLRLDKSIHSRENLRNLLYLRVALFSGNTLVTAAFPFMGDIVNLLGSFSLIPLTFLFPSMIYMKVKGKSTRMGSKLWHWGIIIVFSLLTVATTISAVRLIVLNVKQYSLFADP